MVCFQLSVGQLNDVRLEHFLQERYRCITACLKELMCQHFFRFGFGYSALFSLHTYFF